MKFKPAEEVYSKIEKSVLRKIYVLLSIFTVSAVIAGIGIGIFISGQHASAIEPTNLETIKSMSSGFAEVARTVEPAVVNIDTKGIVPPEITLKGEKPEGSSSDEILEYFKKQLPRRPSYAVGSGFIVDKSGYILTNYHVIEDSSRITVRLQNGEEYLAKIIGRDEETDLAVLKIDAGKDLPSVRLGDSNSAQVGDWVLAIGSPFNLAQTVTAGIVSHTNRETPFTTPFQTFIQTDAAINRGNSGGPLVNMQGEVIGINSQIATMTGDYNGIGFALPSNEARYVYNQILQGGKVRRGFLGVGLDSVKTEFAKIYNLPEAKGAIITSVNDKESAAAKGGLQVNDIIIEYNGQIVENAKDLIAKVSATQPEKDANIVYLREINNNLERKTTTIKLDERVSLGKDEEETPRRLTTDTEKEKSQPLGLTVAELTPQQAINFKLDGQKGLIIKAIDPASFIADLKAPNGADSVNEGDLIQRINRVPVTDLKTFNEIAGKLKPGDAVVLHLAVYSRRTQRVQMKIVQFTVK